PPPWRGDELPCLGGMVEPRARLGDAAAVKADEPQHRAASCVGGRHHGRDLLRSRVGPAVPDRARPPNPGRAAQSALIIPAPIRTAQSFSMQPLAIRKSYDAIHVRRLLSRANRS